MDIQITPRRSAKPVWLGAGLAGLCFLSFYLLGQDKLPTASASDLTLLTVHQGPLEMHSQAFGELFSAEERLLTSQALGKVAAIHVRPGAKVEPDSLILTLSNPELEQQVSHARGELVRQQAALQSYQLEQNNARLDFEGRIAAIAADLEEAELELKVFKELSERGVSARLDILRAELEVKQQAKRLDFEQQKYRQFLKMQTLQYKQQEIEVDQEQQQLDLLVRQLENMQVRAGIAGTLQSLEVELGQNVPQGASLGKVGSDSKLLARLRIPQHQADLIKVGAPVQVETRKGQVTGRVNRIESVVNNGVVLAEVGFDQALPVDARPAMPVTGQIFIQSMDNALSIPQAAGLSPRTQLQRFVIAEHGLAVKRTIELGDVSQGRLVVLSGLQPNEQLVAQMHDSWADHEKIQLQQKG
ncbi:efflux RND transporter periplasmic adaptor subunit [Bowmanella dokdonensis]|uniref:HlyD family efflux transporter periplasmic adaptor subunit n=1 Tax=Bowmanella dokdonensis TaxID=751969 RepID=A0A939DNN1_9ALTE|nr:HlyD family efflux transporter periplasmic adaptor subunit [Bowmanella dokdonensis]MBN7825848.1 HlyD family efflux transporter periplasmic adaptor subunit [Bowmanella dokdonensis]